MELRCFLIQLAMVWIGGAVYSSNICRKSDIDITDSKVTVKSFTSSLDLTKDDITTSKMVVGCPNGYQMRVDYAWTYQTYQQPNGNTLIEVNCSQLFALDKTQICFKGCSIPKLDDVVISPLPANTKQGPAYVDGDTIRVQCGNNEILSTCRDSMWSNLSEYNCPKGNTSSRTLAIVLDTTTNMGEEIAQVYDIVQGIVDKLDSLENKPNINYVLVPFNDPDFYPMLLTTNGTVLLHHLDMINQHGASGGKDCPELSLAAIQKALKDSHPGSDVFVFTDASSKEPERKDIIIREATRKRIKVNFVLTGHCGDNQMDDQAIYYETAESTGGFMVNVAKTDIRELYSVMESGLMQGEEVTHSVLNVERDMSYVVQVPVDKRVHRMTVSVSCNSVRIISVTDDKGADVRYHHVSTLRDMMTVMVLPSIADHVKVNMSCGERGSALVTASTITDIKFNYQFYHTEVGSSLALTDTVDMNDKILVFVQFSAAVYDVTVSSVVLNVEGAAVSMKKYLDGYIAEIDAPSFVFYLKFQSRYSGQVVQRLSSPVIPRVGCKRLVPTKRLLPSTLLSRDRSRVRFTCDSQCYVLSHVRELVCDKDTWSEEPPLCVDAGYTCPELIGPGNGTIVSGNHIVYTLQDAKCGQTVEVHCNTYFELEGASTSICTPAGWTNSENYCRAVKQGQESPEVTKVLGEWWLWVVISVTTVFTLSVMFTVICILVVRRGKRKTRVEYTTRGVVNLPPDDAALNVDEDIYEVVDCNGNYSNGCQPLCGVDTIQYGRPPMPPPLSTNSYGNLPHIPVNPLYSRATGTGHDYMPMSGSNGAAPCKDVRSASMIYEEMRDQAPASSNVDDYNAYDYATGHV